MTKLHISSVLSSLPMTTNSNCNSTNFFSFFQLMHDVLIQFPTIAIWHRLPQLVVSKYLIGFPTSTIFCTSVSLNSVFHHMNSNQHFCQKVAKTMCW